MVKCSFKEIVRVANGNEWEHQYKSAQVHEIIIELSATMSLKWESFLK